MTHLRTLQGVLTHLAEGRPDVRANPSAGASDASSRATDFFVGSTRFAVLDEAGNTVDLRLDPAVARAATRTPDTVPSDHGPEWVRFAPAELDDHAVDRLEAWFAFAARHAAARD
jgi:hypothetical protein